MYTSFLRCQFRELGQNSAFYEIECVRVSRAHTNSAWCLDHVPFSLWQRAAYVEYLIQANAVDALCDEVLRAVWVCSMFNQSWYGNCSLPRDDLEGMDFVYDSFMIPVRSTIRPCTWGDLIVHPRRHVIDHIKAKTYQDLFHMKGVPSNFSICWGRREVFLKVVAVSSYATSLDSSFSSISPVTGQPAVSHDVSWLLCTMVLWWCAAYTTSQVLLDLTCK